MNNNEIKKFRDIGKEYRDNFSHIIIKGIVFQSIASLLITGAIALLFLFCSGIIGLTKDEYQYVCKIIGIVSIFNLSILTIVIISRAIIRTTQLRNSDEWLGKKYAITNKRVKGCALRKVRSLLIVLPLICFIFLPFNIITVRGSYLESPALQENLILIEGEIDYFDVYAMKKTEVFTFGLKDNTTLYRISYDSYYSCDKSIKEEIKVGDYVYLSIDSTEKTKKTTIEGYEAISNVYTFRSASKEYLTYEQYINYFNEDKKIVNLIYFSNYFISGLAFLGLVAAITYVIVRSTKEDILISNLS